MLELKLERRYFYLVITRYICEFECFSLSFVNDKYLIKHPAINSQSRRVLWRSEAFLWSSGNCGRHAMTMASRMKVDRCPARHLTTQKSV